MLAAAANGAQTITNVFLGTTPNDGTGDSLRTAFSKLNTNDVFLQAQIESIEVGTANQTNISWTAITNLPSAEMPLSVITNANHLTNWSKLSTNILSDLTGGGITAEQATNIAAYQTLIGTNILYTNVVARKAGTNAPTLYGAVLEKDTMLNGSLYFGDFFWTNVNGVLWLTNTGTESSAKFSPNVSGTMDITANLTGTAASADVANFVNGTLTNSITGNATTAGTAQTAYSLAGPGGSSVYGDVTGYAATPAGSTWSITGATGAATFGSVSGNGSGLTGFTAGQLGGGAALGKILYADEANATSWQFLDEYAITNALGYSPMRSDYVPPADWIATYGPTEGSFLVRDGQDMAWTLSGSALTNLNASSVSSGSLGLARIAQGSASSGDVLKWNGSAWSPGSDNTASGGSLDISATAQTTDDTPTYMSLGLAITSTDMALVNVTILAKNSTRTVWGWRHILVVCEGTTVTVMDDVTPNNSNPGPTIGTCDINAGTLRIAITGTESTTIDWKAVGWSTKL